MADNLQLQQQLAEAAAAQLRSQKGIESSLSKQIQLTAQLRAALDATSVDNLKSNLQSVQQVLSDMEKQSDSTKGKNVEMLEASSRGAQKASGQFNKLGVVSLKSTSRVAGLLSGMSAGIGNLSTLSGAAIKGLTGIVGVVYKIAKGIFSIPLKIFKSLISAADNFAGDTSLLQAFENVRKEFGSFKESASSDVVGAFKDIRKGLGATGLSAFQVFETPAEALKQLTELAVTLGNQFVVFGSELRRSAGDIVGFQKGLGLTNEQMQGIANRAGTLGTTMQEQLRLTANYSLQLAKDFGLSQKLIGKDIGKMIKDVKHFAGLTQKEMAMASVYTQKLGISIDSLTALVEKFDSFDSAAESSAQLSQAFGVTTDAMELLSAANPAERLDLLRKSFSQAGVSTDSFNRQQLKLLATQTGLSEEQAQLAFSSKNAGLSYDEIKKKSTKAENAQLKQTEALNKLADSIERVVRSGGSLGVTGFFDAFIKGFARGVTNSKPFIGTLMTLKRGLHQTLAAGFDVGKFFGNNKLAKIGEGFTTLFSAANFSNLFYGAKDAQGKVKQFGGVVGQLKAVVSGKQGIGEALESIKGQIKNFFANDAGKKFLEGFKELGVFFAKNAGSLSSYLLKGLKSTIDNVTSFLTNPKAFIDSLKSAGNGATSFAGELINQFTTAFGDGKIFSELGGSITKMFEAAFKYVKDWFNGSGGKILSAISGLALGYIGTKGAIGASKASGGIELGKSILGVVKSGIETAGKFAPAVAKTPASSATTGVGQISSAIAEGTAATKDTTASDILKFAGKLAAITLAIGLGGAAYIYALIKLAPIIGAIPTEQLLKTGGAISAAFGTAALISLAAAGIAKAGVSIGDVAKGALIITGVTAAMALVGGLITAAIAGVNPETISKAATFMTATASIFLAAVPVTLAAGALGLLATGPQAVGLLAIPVGLAALTAVITAMTTSILSIVSDLSAIPAGELFKQKVETFVLLVDGVSNLIKAITGVLTSSSFSFEGLFKDKTSENLSKIGDTVKVVGESVKTLLDTLRTTVSSLAGNKQTIAAAKEFGTILSALSGVIEAIKPPPELIGKTDSWFGVINTTNVETMKERGSIATSYMDGLKSILNPGSGLMSAVETLSKLPIQNPQKVETISKLVTSFVGIINALRPPPELLKAIKDTETGKIDLTEGSITSMKETLNVENLKALSGIFDASLSKVIDSIFTKASAFITSIPEKADLGKINTAVSLVSAFSGVIGSVTKLLGISFVKIDPKMLAAKDGEKGMSPETLKQIEDRVNDNLSTKIGTIMSSISKATLDFVNSISESVSKNQLTPQKIEQGKAAVTSIKPIIESISAISTTINSIAALDSDGKGSITDKLQSFNSFTEQLIGKGGADNVIAQLFNKLKTFTEVTAKNASPEYVKSLKLTSDYIVQIANVSSTLQKSLEKEDSTFDIGSSIDKIFGKTDFQAVQTKIAGYKNELGKLSESLNKVNAEFMSALTSAVDITSNVDAAQVAPAQKTFTIKRGEYTLNVNLQVNIDPDKFERAIIVKKDSILGEVAVNNSSQLKEGAAKRLKAMLPSAVGK